MKKFLLVLLGAMLLVPTLIFAEGEKKVDFYGSAQYRLRYRMMSTSYDTSDGISANDYQDKLAYNFGAKVKVNEQVSMQMELGNAYIATETVGWMNATNMFQLAYATWSQSMFDLTIGIQPVKGNPVLDLIERSVNDTTYKAASHVLWAVTTTNSLAGIKIGVPILKGETSFGVNLFSSPLLERGAVKGTDDSRISSPSAILWCIDLPFKQGALSITPNVAVIFNRLYFDDNELVDNGSDMELGYGFTGAYKLNDGISFNAGFGMASVSNENSTADSILVGGAVVAGNPVFKRTGMYLTAGTAIKAGPGKVQASFSYSTDENTEVADSKTAYPFVDLKYGYAANSNFTVMPRVRVFMTSYLESAGDMLSAMEIRPELIFIGKF